jgi:hypothetical protein
MGEHDESVIGLLVGTDSDRMSHMRTVRRSVLHVQSSAGVMLDSHCVSERAPLAVLRYWRACAELCAAAVAASVHHRDLRMGDPHRQDRSRRGPAAAAARETEEERAVWGYEAYRGPNLAGMPGSEGAVASLPRPVPYILGHERAHSTEGGSGLVLREFAWSFCVVAVHKNSTSIDGAVFHIPLHRIVIPHWGIERIRAGPK